MSSPHQGKTIGRNKIKKKDAILLNKLIIKRFFKVSFFYLHYKLFILEYKEKKYKHIK
jgi:hypothetical protein